MFKVSVRLGSFSLVEEEPVNLVMSLAMNVAQAQVRIVLLVWLRGLSLAHLIVPA